MRNPDGEHTRAARSRRHARAPGAAHQIRLIQGAARQTGMHYSRRSARPPANGMMTAQTGGKSLA
jgi:hypothetical protein